MSGIVSRSPNMNSGTVDRFPSGHTVGSTVLANEAHTSTHISSSSTSYTDSGVYGSYTPKYPSSITWLKVFFTNGMQQFGTETTEQDCTMDDANSTSWVYGNSMGSGSSGNNYNNRQTGSNNDNPALSWIFRQIALGNAEVTTPPNQTSYAAGQLFYFRLYYKTSAGTYYWAHQDGYWNFWLEEIML